MYYLVLLVSIKKRFFFFFFPKTVDALWSWTTHSCVVSFGGEERSFDCFRYLEIVFNFFFFFFYPLKGVDFG